MEYGWCKSTVRLIKNDNDMKWAYLMIDFVQLSMEFCFPDWKRLHLAILGSSSQLVR